MPQPARTVITVPTLSRTMILVGFWVLIALFLLWTGIYTVPAESVGVVQRFGGLDVLLYGAADSDRTATVLELDEAAWIRINLTGAFLMVTT